jgi:hypothetical protein
VEKGATEYSVQSALKENMSLTFQWKAPVWKIINFHRHFHHYKLCKENSLLRDVPDTKFPL